MSLLFRPKLNHCVGPHLDPSLSQWKIPNHSHRTSRQLSSSQMLRYGASFHPPPHPSRSHIIALRAWMAIGNKTQKYKCIFTMCEIVSWTWTERRHVALAEEVMDVALPTGPHLTELCIYFRAVSVYELNICAHAKQGRWCAFRLYRRVSAKIPADIGIKKLYILMAL